MNPIPISVVDSEESVFLDASTAPTTPEGSLSFSPILRAARYDGVEDEGMGNLTAKSRNNSRSLSSTLLDSTARSSPVRNICCVGAGYVGTCC
jgi:UDPglucose 6-dehydrogenase